MNEDYPRFEQAVGKFKAFLGEQGWPVRLLWVRPTDFRRRGPRVAIRSASDTSGESHARLLYAEAAAFRRGVLLEALCHRDGWTFARVVRPVTDDASERLMVSDGLKLSVPVEPDPPQVVQPRWLWPIWVALGKRWPPIDSDIEA
jgi:hypothetical protein